MLYVTIGLFALALIVGVAILVINQTTDKQIGVLPFAIVLAIGFFSIPVLLTVNQSNADTAAKRALLHAANDATSTNRDVHEYTESQSAALGPVQAWTKQSSAGPCWAISHPEGVPVPRYYGVTNASCISPFLANGTLNPAWQWNSHAWPSSPGSN